jgi:hypothetical protein
MLRITYSEGFRLRTKEWRVGDEIPQILQGSPKSLEIRLYADGVELRLLQKALEFGNTVSNWP